MPKKMVLSCEVRCFRKYAAVPLIDRPMLKSNCVKSSAIIYR